LVGLVELFGGRERTQEVELTQHKPTKKKLSKKNLKTFQKSSTFGLGVNGRAKVSAPQKEKARDKMKKKNHTDDKGQYVGKRKGPRNSW